MRDRATARSRSAAAEISDPLLPQGQRLVDANKFHRAAMIARERARFKTVELIDGLELNAGATAIAFEMAGADIIIAVPTMRHLKPQVGLAPFRRPSRRNS